MAQAAGNCALRSVLRTYQIIKTDSYLLEDVYKNRQKLWKDDMERHVKRLLEDLGEKRGAEAERELVDSLMKQYPKRLSNRADGVHKLRQRIRVGFPPGLGAS